MLSKNVGGADRAVRLVLGVAALAVAFLMLDAAKASVPGIIAAAAGGVFILTALVGFCPAYLPLKLSTCKAKPAA
jgi:hypothetical protein